MPNLVPDFLLTPLFAQVPPVPGTGPAPGPFDFIKTIGPFVLMIGAMYFLMIAPQNKKRKELAKMINALATGDEILTVGGIYGVITNVKPDRLVVKIAEGTKIEITRASVQSVEKKVATD